MTHAVQDLILKFRCPDQPGILAAVTAAVFESGLDIRDAAQFGEPGGGQFFVRMHLATTVDGAEAAFRKAFEPVAQRLALQWQLTAWSMKPRTLIAVSKFGHCLNDLLHKWQAGLLHTEIVGVVSNHQDMRSLVEWHGLPYHYLPVTPETKAAQEAKIIELMDIEKVDLLVLARYMQILSENMCNALNGRCINIHHSFLPSFKGASPYKRAYERGVKLVGATAHYVTSDLDEGPIIEQDVARADHSKTVEALTAMGRDTESQVLARAVKWHSEHRVLINGHKTVIFK